MPHFTTSKAFRLVITAFGVLFSLVALISAFSLLSARTVKAVVLFKSITDSGELTNRAYVNWGVIHWLQPGDLPSPPKEGDSVTILAIGKSGTVKFSHSYWRAWTWTGGFAVVGFAFTLGGLLVLREVELKRS